MKSLETVQKIAKVLKILCLIGFIFTIIGTIGAAVSGFVLLIIQELNDDIKRMLISNPDIPDAATQGIISIVNAIVVLGNCVILGFAYRYLKNELADGTPFTYRGAKEFLRLGIISVAVPLGAMLLSEIIIAVAEIKSTLSIEYSLAGGIMMILLSFVFKYGAELNESKKAEENTENTAIEEKTEVE